MFREVDFGDQVCRGGGGTGEAGQRVGKKRAEAGRSQVEEVARPG